MNYKSSNIRVSIRSISNSKTIEQRLISQIFDVSLHGAHHGKACLLICKPYKTPNALIRITCSCNEHPLTPHVYIVKLGFTWVYRGIHFFLNFALKHRSWVLVRTASPTIYVLNKNKKNITDFHKKISFFNAFRNCCKLHG